MAAVAAAAGTGGSPVAPQLPPTFAHLLAYLIATHGPNHVDSAALAPLMAHKAYAAAVGSQVRHARPDRRVTGEAGGFPRERRGGEGFVKRDRG
jgi:hypothetical protein